MVRPNIRIITNFSSRRIELCIQRYKSKRKFDALRSQIFTTYLTLGGISTGPKQFSGGLDYKQNDHLDKEQLETMAATDFVSTSLDEDDEWEVDFPFVVRGFLSHRVPYVLGYTEVAHLELAAQVVRNFLNYVSLVFPLSLPAKILTRDRSYTTTWRLSMRTVSTRLFGSVTWLRRNWLFVAIPPIAFQVISTWLARLFSVVTTLA